MVLTKNFKNVIIKLIRKNYLAITIIKRQDPRLLEEVGDLIDSKSTLTA
jgi:hypothetical protein